MPGTQVRVYVDEGEVHVRYNREIIKILSPEEALGCGGNIRRAGAIARNDPEKTIEEPITYQENIELKTTKTIRQSKKNDNDELDNKNDLINGPM